MITIFTDGSSKGNPGPGGWAAILIKNAKSQVKSDGIVTEFGGSERNTTNNRMELTAAIRALLNTPENTDITLYADSSYLINGVTKWLKEWKRNGWKTKTKEDVLNDDLWRELDALISERTIDWNYVSGHAGVAGNERCDEIAVAFADGQPIQLFKGPFNKYRVPDILKIKKSKLKARTKSRKKTAVYSYISSVGGVIEVHHSWTECEKRVKGAKGARFKKALDVEDERKIIDEFEEV
jgi:ribonuclease HI